MREDVMQELEGQIKKQEEKLSEIHQAKKKLAKPDLVDGVEMDGNEFKKVSQETQKHLQEEGRKYEELNLKAAKLENLDDEELIRMVAKMPDVGFREDYQKYIDVLEEFEEVQALGLAAQHPEAKQKKKVVAEQRERLLKRAKNTREGFLLELELIQKRQKKMRQIINESSNYSNSMDALLKNQNAIQMKLDELQSKYDLEKVKIATPSIGHVMHELPTLPNSPITKGRDFFSVIFASISFFGGLFLAALLIYLAELVFPRAAKD